jgi:hypothetical protein
MAAMLNIDRHIAIWAGWIAGPAFGVAMMAAPEYLHLGPILSAVLFWGGIIVFLLTIAVVVVLSLHEKKKRKAVLGPVILMSMSAVAFCVGAAWYFWPSKAKEEVKEAEAPSTNLDRKISFNCYLSARPTHMREDRPLHTIQIAAPAPPGVPANSTIGKTYFIAGKDEIKWSPGSSSQYMKCVLTNHSETTIFKASIGLQFDWIDSKGNIVRSGDSRSPDFEISSGNEDYFYVVNQSYFLVRMAPSDTITVYTSDSESPKNVKLAMTNSPLPAIVLFPRPEIKSPPIEPPPVPMPPSRPRGR